ncbi:sensor histidine kinase [Actinoplanes rectilineatus]|uniref:sensor histidine kinase n=1 Tax=Actinoplanes rectilineatus TaxID=113571 RepID=UPI0009FB1CAA|nr:nitrate- and nitrite sensing domain-containing protein [Actinoplanes rectilineatus]
MTAADGALSRAGGRQWQRLADRPIRSKLTLLLTIPLIAILTLALLIGVTGALAAGKAEQARRLVSIGVVGGELTSQLQRERVAAAAVFAQPSRPGVLEAYRRQAEATDAVTAQFVAAQQDLEAPAGLAAPLQRLDTQLTALPLLREQVRSGQDTAGSLTVFRYRALTAELGGYRTALSQLGVDAETANGLRATATVSQAIEALGLMQVAVLPAIRKTPLTAAEQQQILSAQGTFNEALETFRQIAPAGWQALLAGQSSSKTALAGERLQGVAARAQANAPLNLDSSTGNWVTATNARMQQLHAAEHQFDTELLASVTSQRDQQRRNLLWLGVSVIIVLAALGVVGWWVTASITRPLRALQAQASTVANTHLPAVVARLASGAREAMSPAALVAQVMDAPADAATDEVSAVRRAFIEVSATALDLAGQQAAARQIADRLARQEAEGRRIADQAAAQEAQARAVVSEIVTNVARRLQGLVAKLMSLIDALEQNEDDPARLEKIFPVDHQANQSQRYILNLLIIAGQWNPAPAPAPVSLFEVIRGAAGRLQDYRQIEPMVDAGIMIAREAVEELVHLLTELFANAVDFSPRGSAVEVVADVLHGRLRVAIIDKGPGVRAELIPGLLHQMSAPDLDPQAVKQMGLVVVGRLATRLGLGVDIRSGHELGTIVELSVPDRLFTLEEPVWVPHAPATASGPPPPVVPGPVPAQPMPADATQLLPALATTVHYPTGGSAPAGATASPTVETLIFQRVCDESPWFSAGTNATQPLPSFVPTWPNPAAAATTNAAVQAAAEPTAAGRTRSGLPKRVRSAPPPGFADRPLISDKDPKTTSGTLAAFAAATRASRSAS